MGFVSRHILLERVRRYFAFSERIKIVLRKLAECRRIRLYIDRRDSGQTLYAVELVRYLVEPFRNAR